MRATIGRVAHAVDPRGRKVPFARAVSIALATLASIPLLISLGIALATGINTTLDLVATNAKVQIDHLVERSGSFLDPAVRAAQQVAAAIREGRIDSGDAARLGEAMRLVLSVSPQLSSVVHIDLAGPMVLTYRGPDGQPVVETGDWREEPATRAALADAETLIRRGHGWNRPFYIEGAAATILPYLEVADPPDGSRRAIVIASIRLEALSRFTDQIPVPGGQAFILYQRNYVIAHPALARGAVELSSRRPLPTLGEVGDPVLAAIWDAGWQERRLDLIGNGHFAEVDDVDYAYVYEPFRPPGGDEDWLVGVYVREDVALRELRRFAVAGLAGLATLALAILAAVWLARRISRPVAEIAGASRALTRLDFATLPGLRHSTIAELDDAATAFNRMAPALRLFARYVPRRIVERLLVEGAEPRQSEERVVTVMFCDLAGFTRYAEGRSAVETAAMLNGHFGRIATCIEAEAGTIDKYIGDALMAFWNAPDRQPDHAARAVRAALAIAAADPMTEDGPTLRIGIHTGTAVVGDLGAPSRLNYTIVGDTVNVAQRLETMGRLLQPDARTAILLSEATAAELPSTMQLSDLGRHRVRGRREPIAIHTPLVEPGSTP